MNSLVIVDHEHLYKFRATNEFLETPSLGPLRMARKPLLLRRGHTPVMRPLRLRFDSVLNPRLDQSSTSGRHCLAANSLLDEAVYSRGLDNRHTSIMDVEHL